MGIIFFTFCNKMCFQHPIFDDFVLMRINLFGNTFVLLVIPQSE